MLILHAQEFLRTEPGVGWSFQRERPKLRLNRRKQQRGELVRTWQNTNAIGGC